MTDPLVRVGADATVGLVERVFAWSLIFESLLFFILGSQFATGFTITIGKALQLFLMAWLLLGRIAYGRDIWVANPRSPQFRYFTAFLVLAIISGIAGALSGAYVLENQYFAAYASNAVARIIRGAGTRPFIEYAILLYYFLYFAVLPGYLLKTDAAKGYFFKYFRLAFVLCLSLGFIDLFLETLGYSWLPRDMSEGRHVGFRFHGLAGEPRDAFVYLMLGLAVLNLREYWVTGKGVGRKWIVVAFLAILFTQSASGLLGLLFATLLVVALGVRSLSLKNFFWLGATSVLIVVLVFASYKSSPRLQLYVDGSTVIYDNLKTGTRQPDVIRVQMANIYPIWDLYQKTLRGNVYPLFFGSGLGSSSVVNNNLGDWNEMTNPHAQVIRLVYECGIVGTLLLIGAFVYPVRRLTASLDADTRRRFLVFTCLLVGVFLAHRSTAPFIFLGIFIAVMGKNVAAPAWRRRAPATAARMAA